MRIFGIEIWDDEGQLTTFYTIRKDGAESSETDEFFMRYEGDTTQVENARLLATFILEVIGDHEGAKKEHFRFEGAVDGLPPEPRHAKRLSFDVVGFPLRLYCMRLTHGLVILMNGGVKTGRTAQESGDLKTKFDEANAFAKAIDRALKEKIIVIDASGRKLLWNDDEMIIHS